ncbi:hypothetical protein NVP1081O_235 [Vibrio phage 1.081.O._10N.286.52.C2]|nr:hypothetical protein NVP1081O_235 [Vibrio phage 1.081.O._10N.286.52.C2]
MDITQLSDDDLQNEINRRAKEAAKFPSVILTEEDTESVIQGLEQLAMGYLDDERRGNEIETQWAYEFVMVSVFGTDVFERMNKL